MSKNGGATKDVNECNYLMSDGVKVKEGRRDPHDLLFLEFCTKK